MLSIGRYPIPPARQNKCWSIFLTISTLGPYFFQFVFLKLKITCFKIWLQFTSGLKLYTNKHGFSPRAIRLTWRGTRHESCDGWLTFVTNLLCFSSLLLNQYRNYLQRGQWSHGRYIVLSCTSGREINAHIFSCNIAWKAVTWKTQKETGE
jgi:hypothetical protein